MDTARQVKTIKARTITQGSFPLGVIVDPDIIGAAPWCQMSPASGLIAYSGTSGSPASVAIQISSAVGLLPGFPSNTYPVLWTNHTSLLISVGGSFASYISPSGTYTAVSGRSAKQNFRKLAGEEVLAKIASMDVQEWEFVIEPGVKRIGPVAEDFHAAFGLGAIKADPADRTLPEHEAMIAPSDVAGVALLGVRELIPLVRELQKRAGI